LTQNQCSIWTNNPLFSTLSCIIHNNIIPWYSFSKTTFSIHYCIFTFISISYFLYNQNKNYVCIYKFYNAFNILLLCYNEYKTMILYNKMVHNSSQKNSIIYSCVEFIVALLNKNTCESLYLIATYKLPKLQIILFCSILKSNIYKCL
jgi:hypothetical protein